MAEAKHGAEHTLRPLSQILLLKPRALFDAGNITKWLLQLVTLALVSLELDTATAGLICQLPSLKHLTLNILPFQPSFAGAISSVLTLGHTRTNLDLFNVYSNSTSERRLIQRILGIDSPIATY